MIKKMWCVYVCVYIYTHTKECHLAIKKSEIMQFSATWMDVLLLLLLSHFSHRRQPTRIPSPWDSPDKNTGVGCHFLLQSMKEKSESEVAQSCLTLSDPMDCSLPGSSIYWQPRDCHTEWIKSDRENQYHMMSLICVIFKKMIQTYLQDRFPVFRKDICLPKGKGVREG